MKCKNGRIGGDIRVAVGIGFTPIPIPIPTNTLVSLYSEKYFDS